MEVLEPRAFTDNDLVSFKKSPKDVGYLHWLPSVEMQGSCGYYVFYVEAYFP